MTITTAGTAVHLAPTITKTFFKHYYKKAKRSLKSRSHSRNSPNDSHDRRNATDEFMFDEAFHIVKSFINLGTSDTVEAIQNFTDAPAPPIPWATTLPVMIPMESCDKAAKLIIDHLGPGDLEKLVGGEKWWQLRPLPGLQGEWIAMSDDWKKMKNMEKQQGSAAQTSKPATAPARRRRNKRHERARTEIRAMRQKTESALKCRSQSFKRRSPQDADAQPSTSTSPTAAEANVNDDAASTASSTTEDAHVPQPNITSSDLPSDDEDDHAAETEELDRLQRVMLYFHGGGYYFGSLATHRYQIVRYARKFGGKCFAPIYRKAPQYPWPCALQDAVASYLYLIDPPPGAKHTAVDPKKLVVAGDSAGGGLTLALLTVIRDMGLPAPAGAVLISPWCDLTHSFPSILQNTATDIIPPYGFIHKPSTLWPVNATKPVIKEKGNDEDGKMGKDGEEEQPRRKVPVGVDEDGSEKKKDDDDTAEPAARKNQEGGNLFSTDESKDADSKKSKNTPTPAASKNGVPPAPDLLWSEPITITRADPSLESIELREQIQLYATNDQLTHPLCSTVLSGSLGGLPPLYILAGDAEVLRDEIVYLAHRAAHPSRYPLRHDLLDHCERSRENAEKFDSQPTKVHLQIYDQMCHVLTAFAFTSQSRFAYRAVASFVKHVTGAPTNIKNPFPEVQEGEGEQGREEGELAEIGDRRGDDEDDGVSDNVGGEVKSPPLASSLKSSQNSMLVQQEKEAGTVTMSPSSSGQGSGSAPVGLTPLPGLGEAVNGAETKSATTEGNVDSGNSRTGQLASTSHAQLRDEPESMSAAEASHSTTANSSTTNTTTTISDPSTNATSTTSTTKSRHRSMSKVINDTLHFHPSGSSSSHPSRHITLTLTLANPTTRPRAGTNDVANEYAGQVPLLRPSFQSFMIRERVDVRGYLRPLEPETELQALQVDPESIGRIKEGPVERYLDGQHQWEKRFAKTAKRVEKRRAKNEQLAVKMLEEAANQGLLDVDGLKKKKSDGLVENANNGTAAAGGGKGLELSKGSVDVGSQAEKTTRESWTWLADFGPMDLIHERPPPAAIAGRRDTDDALVLLRRSLQIRARAYGIHRKSKFWSTAEDKPPVRAHLRAQVEDSLATETSTDPNGETVRNGNGEGEGNGKGKGRGKGGKHHHRGLRVWNFLMVRKPPLSVTDDNMCKGKSSRTTTPRSENRSLPTETETQS